MKSSKSTKRALLGSVAIIALCLAMLLGTTFAWFTDTASTAVNTIQSGTLDVKLEMKEGDSWVDAAGKTLQFKKAPDAEDEKILWEPGCTYELPELRITNQGNLALDYKVEIAGIQGSAELNNAIIWTIGENAASTATQLLPGASKEFTIKGHMKETAGNEYQGLSIDGIAITVYATQSQYEYDSNGNTYDADADMTPDNLDKLVSANVTAAVTAGGETVLENTDKTVKATVPQNAVAEDATSLTLTVVPQSSNTGNVTLRADAAYQAYEVQVTGLKEDNTEAVTVELFVGKGLTGVKLYHNGTEMESNAYKYDKDTGVITFETATFSPFTVVYDAPEALMDGTSYPTLQTAFDAARGGETITLLKDVSLTDVFKVDRSITINGQGHSIYNTANRVIRITKPNVDVKLYNLGVVSQCTATEDTRGISFDNTANGSKLLLDNCKVSAPHYAINFSAGSGVGVSNVTLTVENGTVAAGWAAINSYSNNSTYVIENTTLKGLNDKSESSWNDFATIVFDGDGLTKVNNAGVCGSKNTMTIKNSTVYAISESSNKQAWLVLQYGAQGNTITATGTKIVDANGNDQSDNIATAAYTGNPHTPYNLNSTVTIDSKTYQYNTETTAE